MVNLEQRLREDAAEIRAEVPPQLKTRLKASLRRAQVNGRGRAEARYPLWLAGSLTGVVAALFAVGVINWRGSAGPDVDAEEFRGVPGYVAELERELPLAAKTADLTAPLETELENLRADLEKARENVEQDLRFAF